MKECIFEIISNTKLADNTYEMVFAAPEGEHGVTNPGQFVNIRIEGYFLRRPISVCDWDEKSLTIVYKSVGKGTEAMSRMSPGEKLSVLTPLGNGYGIEALGKRPLLVGGGAGVPPMYGLCRTLTEAGKKPVVVLGFNKSSEIFYKEKFKALGAEVIIATADGSEGIRGFVTDAVRDLEFTDFCACGPEPMLKALDKTIAPEINGFMSFEERMGCGFGACMGCSCETKYGYKRICKEGPVLERGEIIW